MPERHPHITKSKKRPHPMPVDRPSDLAPAAKAFEALEADYAKLPATALISINLDIPRAVATILGAEPRVRLLLPAMEAEMKNPPTAIVDGLRQAALGAWYAHLITLPSKSGETTKELLDRATSLRAKLLKAADALADAELVDAMAVARIREGSGNLDKATDLVALAALFSQSWSEIHDKTAITLAQMNEAASIGPSLLLALSEQPLPKSGGATDMRQRAFSHLVSMYDRIRRAVSFVRWDEGDMDAFSPSLYAKSRKRKPSAANDVDEGDESDGDSSEASELSQGSLNREER